MRQPGARAPAGRGCMHRQLGCPPLPPPRQVRVRLVDFAHTFQCEDGSRDTNFLAGLRALLARLRGVVHAQLQQDLT